MNFRAGGQLPLVISFEAVFLFVMSGVGLTPSNFNAEADECKHSGRNVPMIKAFTITLCWSNQLTEAFTLLRLPVQFKELVD